MKKLSARCEAIAGFVSAGESVADIGADHAYVPLYLVREGVSPFAVLTDVKPGPLEKTRASVEKAIANSRNHSEICLTNSLANRRRFWCEQNQTCIFDLRLGDGLEALTEAEVDTVIIAGMGGETIISILSADPEKAGSFRKYILQPRTKTEMLFRWLADSGWAVLTKTAVEERGRMCDIIVCAPKEEKDD